MTTVYMKSKLGGLPVEITENKFLVSKNHLYFLQSC